MRVRARRGAIVGTLALTAVLALQSVGGATGSPSVTAKASSHNAVVTGEVWVTFGHTGYTTATISGTASEVATGAVATLTASAFPFRAPMSTLQTLPLVVTGSSAPFTFRVAPDLETRYEVEIFATSTSTTPEAVSSALPVYTTSWSSASNSESCSVTACTIHINLVSVVPRPAIPVEKAKHQFLYLDVVPWSGGAAPAATTYHLVPGKVSAPTVTGDHVHFRVTITYRRPVYRLWYWYWESCTRDTVGEDGFGLAGHHGCGARTVSPHATYLG